MKLDILDISKKKTGEINLPIQFNEDVRTDLVSRAFLALRSNNRKPYGAKTEAGKRSSSIISKRRHQYRGSYGFGISRTPRKILSRRGTRMNWVGAFAPNTVGGRRAHPPKAEKILVKKLNKKERKKAIRAAISATIIANRVKSRGHIIPENYPFVLNKKFEELVKTKEVLSSLKSLGFEKELERVGEKNVRSGKGKTRGRKYKTKIGPLIVTSKESSITKAASNIPGIDIVNVKNLNIELLAPGEFSGRLTLWTMGAIETLEKEKMFR
ncbi:MAG: 50S ribosomal protein L4 [Candidatus Woesearchaeota archaeon]|jgi:large subunit ribosomal protein L4e|nr:50S ribosomal protein L4 [Candidatus Woesearchaeota archaeon]|tara:strand:- start:13075 stop:13881 length:807 start_codon:yes stop_codon:yes gene_type:complete